MNYFEKQPQTKFQSQQEEYQKQLMRSKSPIFEGAEGELYYIEKIGSWLPSPKIINRRESTKNLYKGIRHSALSYFQLNDIEWWKQSEDLYFPNGNTLSSQVHCLNHLFALRADKDAVLAIIQALLPNICEILPSPIDEKFCYMEKYPYKTPSYISFEFTSENRTLLKERCNKRGANCTSIDVFIYAKDCDNKHVLIPIEWKYTEAYEKNDKNKVKESVVEDRYLDKIDGAISHLRGWQDSYYWDPHYELARQSLLVEQIIQKQLFEADYYQHIVVCPVENTEMRKDAFSFKDSLSEIGQKQFYVIDPEELLSPLNGNMAYDELLKYLKERYWGSVK